MRRLLAETGLPGALEPKSVLVLGIQAAADDSWLVAHAVDASGKFRFVDLRNQAVLAEIDATPPSAIVQKQAMSPRTLLGATSTGKAEITLRWSDGVVSLVRVSATTEGDGKNSRASIPSLETVGTLPPDELGVPEHAVMYRPTDDSICCAAVFGGRKIVVTRKMEDLTGEKTAKRIVLEPGSPGPVTAIAMSSDGRVLYAGTAAGSLLWWKLEDDRVVDRDVVPPSLKKSPITSLRLMLGDITLVAGDADGNVTNWFFVKSESDQAKKTSGAQGMVKESKKLTFIRTLRRTAPRSAKSPPRRATARCLSATQAALLRWTTRPASAACFRWRA